LGQWMNRATLHETARLAGDGGRRQLHRLRARGPGIPGLFFMVKTRVDLREHPLDVVDSPESKPVGARTPRHRRNGLTSAQGAEHDGQHNTSVDSGDPASDASCLGCFVSLSGVRQSPARSTFRTLSNLPASSVAGPPNVCARASLRTRATSWRALVAPIPRRPRKVSAEICRW
jgi:hypothetical protein